MTTFERRQRLLDLLRNRPGLRVPQIAEILAVSQGTVRNDLNALAEAGQVARVRGGATVIDDSQPRSPAFATRARVNESAKRWIARRAADLVEDGDSILLDASTTVFHVAHFLRDRNNLTVVTNGIEVARSLAQNPSNTVILLGGVLRVDGTSVTGPLSERPLRDLHVKTALVSCSGLSLEAGLTEVDIQEAELKSKAITCADSVIALVDSSKFGRVDLTPFTTIDQVSHLFTDNKPAPEWIEQLKQRCAVLTVCNQDTASTFTRSAQKTRHYRIGFANLTEHDPFPVDVRRGLERAAQEAGDIDLVLADNQLDSLVALQVAERFAEQGLDLVIEYHIDEQAGNRIMDRFQQAGIPVIAVDIPMVGATFFGVENYRAGFMAGEALGQWLIAHWDGCFDRLVILEEPRAGALPASRIQGQLDGLESIAGSIPAGKQLRLNSGNTSDVSEAQVSAVLRQVPHPARLAVISFNDDAALGALTAASKLHREADIVIVGQGADRRVREELRHPGSRIIGSTAYYPERYGEKLIPLAIKLLRGEAVPPAVYMEHTFITAAPSIESAG